MQLVSQDAGLAGLTPWPPRSWTPVGFWPVNTDGPGRFWAIGGPGRAGRRLVDRDAPWCRPGRRSGRRAGKLSQVAAADWEGAYGGDAAFVHEQESPVRAQ